MASCSDHRQRRASLYASFGSANAVSLCLAWAPLFVSLLPVPFSQEDSYTTALLFCIYRKTQKFHYPLLLAFNSSAIAFNRASWSAVMARVSIEFVPACVTGMLLELESLPV